MKAKPLCSVLITTYNAIDTFKRSITSVLSQLDDTFEVVIVDNYSNDGTELHLDELNNLPNVRVIKQKCNRGEGRQIGLLEARGKYVIARVDMDAVHNPCFKDVLEVYRKYEKENGPFVLSASVLVSTKEFLLKVGGWVPLQWGENYELYKRLVDKGCLYLMKINEAKLHLKTKRKLLNRMSVSFKTYRDGLRMGLRFKVFAKELWLKCSRVGFACRMFLLTFAWLSQWFYSRYDTFKNVTWEQYFRDEMYQDELNYLEKDKIIQTPQHLVFPKMQTIVRNGM